MWIIDIVNDAHDATRICQPRSSTSLFSYFLRLLFVFIFCWILQTFLFTLSDNFSGKNVEEKNGRAHISVWERKGGLHAKLFSDFKVLLLIIYKYIVFFYGNQNWKKQQVLLWVTWKEGFIVKKEACFLSLSWGNEKLVFSWNVPFGVKLYVNQLRCLFSVEKHSRYSLSHIYIWSLAFHHYCIQIFVSCKYHK